MTPNELIQKEISETNFPFYPMSGEVASKVDAFVYFKNLWDNYFIRGKDESFYGNYELKNYWFYLRIRILIELVNQGNERSYKLLSRELNMNAKKYENRDYKMITSIFRGGNDVQ